MTVLRTFARAGAAAAVVLAAMAPPAAAATTSTSPSTSSSTSPSTSSSTSASTPSTSGSTGSTGATSTAKPADAPTITLVSQTPLLTLGAPALVLRVRVKNPPTRAAVQVALHNPTPSGLAFDDAIQKGELEPELDDTPVTEDISQLPVARDGSIRLIYPLQQPGDRPLVETLKLLKAGVYALDVHLVHCGRCHELTTAPPLVQCSSKAGCPVEDSFVTWVVAVSGKLPSGVDMSWVWQVATAPTNADGSLPSDARDAFSEHGRLERVTDALDDSGTLPITIAAAGETLEAWRTSAAHDAGAEHSFGAFKAALSSKHPDFVVAPWVPIDEQAVHAAGFPSTVTDDFALEAAAVHATVGATPERTTAWLDHADAATLRELRTLGVEQLGIRDVELHPIDAALQHQRVTIAGSPIDVLADDSFLSGLLRGSDPPELRVQRFVAATALLAYDEPARRSGVVLATTAEWQPDRALVSALAAAVPADPLLHATTLAGAFADVTRGNDGNGGPLVRELAPRSPVAFAVPTARVQSTGRALDGYASLVGEHDPQLAIDRRSLLVSMSLLADHDDVESRLGTIDSTIGAVTSAIHASTRSVTLTTAKTKIPVTFTNDTGRQVRLRVELVSDKVSEPGGGMNVTLPRTPVNQTEQLPVQIKTSGRFVVVVQMRSIVGSMPIGAPARVTVNSRVFGSFATWLTWGALGFLALWWAHHILRRRRNVA